MHTELERHYDAKYAAEAEPHGSAFIAPTLRPHDRFSACVSSLARDLPTGAHVLEIGAADGTIAASLLAHRPDITMTISDCSESRVTGLRQRFESDSRAVVEQIDAELGPSADVRPADASVLVALIEHFVDPLHAMQRLRSCLAPGGFAYIDTPAIAKWTRRIKLTLGRFPSTASTNEGLTTYGGAEVDLHDEGHLHYFTFRSLERMLVDRCGFERVTRQPYWIGGGAVVGDHFAHIRPSLFSEIAVTAHVKRA